MKVIKRNDWNTHLAVVIQIELMKIFTAPTQLTNDAISVDSVLSDNHLKFHIPFWSLHKRRCYVYYAVSKPPVHISSSLTFFSSHQIDNTTW